mgnify:CR=1 FL=1
MQKSLVAAAVFAVQQVAADKCYALALSSGDQNSMYQAGVLKGLAQNSAAGTLNYQAISGVAGGAVNTAILANYAAG